MTHALQACSWAPEVGHRLGLMLKFQELSLATQRCQARNRFHCYRRRDLDEESSPLARTPSELHASKSIQVDIDVATCTRMFTKAPQEHASSQVWSR